VEGALDMVQLSKFIGRDRSDPVLRDQLAQFSLCVNAPLIGAGREQSGLGVVIFTEKQHLLERLGLHHNKGQNEQGEQLRFVGAQRVCERLWPGTGRFHVQGVWPLETEL